MASFLSLTAVRSVHPLCLLLWHRRLVVRATEPVSEERVRVWTTTGSWWFSTTTLLPFKRQRRCCEFVWTGQRQRQRRQRTPGQAATEARPLSAAITAWQRRCPRTLSKTTPLYSALFFFKGISVLISTKLTHQKSNRRLSPTAPSEVGVRRWLVDPVCRETVGEMFFPLTPPRSSLDISTPSSLVLVYGRRRQTSNDVWITWFHSWRIYAARI